MDFHEADKHLSQVVNSTLIDGPQTITLLGKPIVIVVSFEGYRKLTQSRPSLSQFFRQSPLHDIELELNRSSDIPRVSAPPLHPRPDSDICCIGKTHLNDEPLLLSKPGERLKLD